jgi:CSLREA domain-containing protein
MRSAKSHSNRSRPRPTRLRLEYLEDREVPATFTVTTFADVVDPADGKLSLREAISRANATPGADTILLTAGVYTLTIPGDDNTNAAGDFDATDSLTITGVGPIATTIKGNHNDRLFDVLGPINMTFNNLTLRDAGNFLFNGAAVQALSANITLNNCVATGNVAIKGGAINAEGGAVTVRNSRLTNNLAGGSEGGGAIHVGSGSLLLDRSTVTGNRAPAGKGGGVFAEGGTVTLSQSTVKLNSSHFSGGGIDSEVGKVTLSNSLVSRNVTDGDGGGVFGRGLVSLTGSSVTGNLAHDGSGGGINGTTSVALSGSTVSGNSSKLFGGGICTVSVSLTNSAVNGNTCQGAGGGISAEGTASLVGSTVNGNTAGGKGGGISASTANLTNSTVAGDTSHGEGGGIAVTAVASLTRSTVSGNTADSNGGGISANTTNLTNSTISGNTAGAGNDRSGEGGGVFTLNGTLLNSTIVENRTVGVVTANGAGVDSRGGFNENVHVKNTIIAENFDPFGDELDVFGFFTSDGNNLVGEIDGGSNGFSAAIDLLGTFDNPLDPRLGPLAANGGPTKTMALLAGSPAIDHGDPTAFSATDQRGPGFPRKKDGNGDGIAVADIGAFER